MKINVTNYPYSPIPLSDLREIRERNKDEFQKEVKTDILYTMMTSSLEELYKFSQKACEKKMN